MAKRPLFMISTEGKTAEQIKAEARSALAGLFAAQDRAKDVDSDRPAATEGDV